MCDGKNSCLNGFMCSANHYWCCHRWYGVSHSSTTAEELHPWTQKQCSSLLRCTIPIWPDTSPHPSGQKLSVLACLKTEIQTLLRQILIYKIVKGILEMLSIFNNCSYFKWNKLYKLLAFAFSSQVNEQTKTFHYSHRTDCPYSVQSSTHQHTHL